jgi:cell division protein ZapA
MDTPDDVKKVVRISILNQTYTVTTSGDPRDTESLAEEIDELMSSIARRAGNLDSTRTAVLACLHLADRLRTAEEELDALKLSVRHKSRDFAMLLDQALLDLAQDEPAAGQERADVESMDMPVESATEDKETLPGE